MEDQWLYGGAWWKELNEQLEARARAKPDLQNTDNIGEIAKEAGPFPPWRQRGRRSRGAKAAVVAVLVVLLSGARYIMSKKSRSHLRNQQASQTAKTSRITQLPLDDGSMQQYLYEFNRAAEEMSAAWEASKMPVRQAFQEYFTPSLEDGQELFQGPLATISEHVNKMRECEVPPDSDMEARREFAQHLHLLRGICRAVTLRLEEMDYAVSVNKYMKEPVSVSSHDDHYNEAASEGNVEGMQTPPFSQSTGMSNEENEQNVDKKLGDNLMLLMDAEDKHDAYNFVARKYFDGFLQPSGGGNAFDAARSTARYQIPYGGESFHSGAFARAAEHIFHDSTPNHEEEPESNTEGDKWTSKEVLKATKRRQEGITNNFEKRLESKREQMRALLNEGIPYDDLRSVSMV